MSYYDYTVSRDISAMDPPFYAIIMAAMRKADTNNTRKLSAAWPEVWDELQLRYNAVDGLLENEVGGNL